MVHHLEITPRQSRSLSEQLPLPGAPPRPLQFPSLEHFDAQVIAAVERMRGVEGLSITTASWAANSYRAFRAFLKASAREEGFLSGHVEQQLEVIDAWVASLRTRNVARSTINSYWRGVRAILTRVQRMRGSVNPFVYANAPHPGNARLRCLTQDAAERVLTFAQHDAAVAPDLRVRNAAILAVMLFAGLRRSEVLHLRVSDVDLIGKVIRVAAGKGQHGGKPRTVPMPPQLVSLLLAYARQRGGSDCGTPAFFLGTREAGPLGERTLRRLFARISSRTGVRVTPHMLRHTFCTLLSRFGVPDRLAKEAMGHADLRMLQRYQHVYEGEVAAAMVRFRLDIDTGDDGLTAAA